MGRKRKQLHVGDWVRGESQSMKFTFYGYVTYLNENIAKVMVTQMWEGGEESPKDTISDTPIIIPIAKCDLFEYDLNIEDVKGMIDFAIDTRDKRLFNKYVKMYRDILNNDTHDVDGFVKRE